MLPPRPFIHAGQAMMLFLIGCLPLDYTPLEERRFYREGLDTLNTHGVPLPVSGPLLTGSAKADITPPEGYPLAGFSGRRSIGVHDPVYARALAVSNDILTIVIVSADVLAMTNDLSEAVTAAVQEKLPIPSDHIMITATHTHSGPGALGKLFWEGLAAGPFDPQYFDWVVEQITQAVTEAYERLRPSVMSSYRFDAGDLVKNRIMADGPEDPEVQVLVFEAKDLSQKTYLINFTAHPTVLRSKNRLVSGDFPGFLSNRLEETDGTIALYTSGALGDLKANPPKISGVFERAEMMGRLLAERILNSDPTLKSQDQVALSSLKLSIPLPPPQPKISTKWRLPAWIGRLFFDRMTIVQFIRINDMFLIGIPGDLGSEIGLSWKKMAREHQKDAMMISFANDYVGYIMPAFYYDKPTHESSMAFNGPYMADYLEGFVKPFILQDSISN